MSSIDLMHRTSAHTYVVIMAGGIGSRFWPASRTAYPKQFLDILGVGRSLIQQTFDRFRKLVPADQIYVVTSDEYRETVAQHLPQLPKGKYCRGAGTKEYGSLYCIHCQ